MALRKILTRGDAALTKPARPVTEFGDRLHELLDDMRETLEKANGLGLAAPQVGILRRLVLAVNEKEEVIELINPVIISQEGEQNGLEGCLSVPGYYGLVSRPMKVRVRAQDRYGAEFEVEGEGRTARCFCHELAHLEGELFTELTDQLYTPEEIEQLFDAEEDDA